MIATELARQDEVEEPLLTANRCLLAGRSRYRDARADNEKKNCLHNPYDPELKREPGRGELAKIGILTKELLREIRRNLPSIKEKDELFAIWREVGGPGIAAATVGVGMRNGFFHVMMDNHILKQEIESFLHEKLLAAMKERLPGKTIRGIRVKISQKR